MLYACKALLFSRGECGLNNTASPRLARHLQMIDGCITFRWICIRHRIWGMLCFVNHMSLCLQANRFTKIYRPDPARPGKLGKPGRPWGLVSTRRWNHSITLRPDGNWLVGRYWQPNSLPQFQPQKTVSVSSPLSITLISKTTDNFASSFSKYKSRKNSSLIPK